MEEDVSAAWKGKGGDAMDEGKSGTRKGGDSVKNTSSSSVSWACFEGPSSISWKNRRFEGARIAGKEMYLVLATQRCCLVLTDQFESREYRAGVAI
jgi:hypothetical protein